MISLSFSSKNLEIWLGTVPKLRGHGGGVWQMSTKGSVKGNTVEKNVHDGEGEGGGV